MLKGGGTRSCVCRSLWGCEHWGCGFSGSEGCLEGLSLLRSFKGLCVLRLLTQRAFKGGGALVCSVPLAIWLMASKQW